MTQQTPVQEEVVPKKPAIKPQPLSRLSPQDAGLDLDALAQLQKRVEASRSDSFVLLKDGKLVVEWFADGKDPGPIETMSVTKSIVSMGVGHAISSGFIETLDQPVYAFYPQWHQGKKQEITVRHLLNHTSGLQADSHTKEIYRSPDFVALALAAELSEAPGSRFFYNNKAVNLLSGIVHRASKQRLDTYMGEHIFAKLGIRDFQWTLDKTGNPHGMSGLQLRAQDLARLGQLMMNRGRWGDTQIIDETWIETSLAPGQKGNPECGLLWWRVFAYQQLTLTDATLKKWKEKGVSKAFRNKLAPMKGEALDASAFFERAAKLLGVDNGRKAFQENVWVHNVNTAELRRGPVVGYAARGYLGQRLVVFPELGLVGVRQLKWIPEYNDPSKADVMADFEGLVRALVP